MLMDLYQEYLYIIGQIKDIYKVDAYPDHKEIHTFSIKGAPLFKLFYGVFQNDKEPSIVLAFHIDMIHPEVIKWFTAIYNISPVVSIHDSWIDDSNGETYIGEDAITIQEVYRAQNILSDWLENHTKEEIEEFTKMDVSGRAAAPRKVFDSQTGRDMAIMEFKRLNKPDDGDPVQ